MLDHEITVLRPGTKVYFTRFLDDEFTSGFSLESIKNLSIKDLIRNDVIASVEIDNVRIAYRMVTFPGRIIANEVFLNFETVVQNVIKKLHEEKENINNVFDDIIENILDIKELEELEEEYLERI